MADPPVALLDVNVTMALTWPSHVHHERAHRWLRGWGAPWATTPLTEAAVVRLSMNPAVVPAGVSAAQALAVLAALRAHPDHRFLADHTSLAEPVIDLSSLAGYSQVTDLHLVNLCARSGAVLATLDARLPGSLRAHDRRHVLVLPA